MPGLSVVPHLLLLALRSVWSAQFTAGAVQHVMAPAPARLSGPLQVTASGQRNLQEHLASKRHVRRVAAQAAEAAHAAAGPEAAQALALAGGARLAAPAAAGGGGGGGAAGAVAGRTYTGVGADVERYVDQASVCLQPLRPRSREAPRRAWQLPLLRPLRSPLAHES